MPIRGIVVQRPRWRNGLVSGCRLSPRAARSHMNEFARYMASIEADLSQERGPFVLFALVRREDLPDRWDLLLSAPWIGKNKEGVVGDLVSRISSKWGSQELINLSRIVVVDPSEPAVVEFNKSFPAEHNWIDLRDSVVFGLPAEQTIVITSRRPETAAVT